MLFENKKITISSHENDKFALTCEDDETTYKQEIEIKKNIIEKAYCSCEKDSICSHLAAALLRVRSELDLLKARRKKSISNKNFIDKINRKELENFIISRMKADKDFKTLIHARFLVDVMGIEHFETYLDRAFPPSKTVQITPSHKEVKLFQKVVEELLDQIKDLIGRDNYIDASAILIPLIKKSFYFKNRFKEIPDAFYKSHLLLVEILRTVHSIIEAPSLVAENSMKIFDLLKLSYVSLTDLKEKELILDLLHVKSNRVIVHDIIEQKNRDVVSPSYQQFINAAYYICGGQNVQFAGDVGGTFIELYTWEQHGKYFLEELLQFAQKYPLPTRFVEKLLTLSPSKPNQVSLQTDLALDNITRKNSFVIFKWVFENHTIEWKNNRSDILDKLKAKNDDHTLIQILIFENKKDELFEHLNTRYDISLFHRFLPELIELSRENTFQLYCNWADHHFSKYYGLHALEEFEKQMRKVSVIDSRLRAKIDQYVAKNFGERPSINM